MRKTVCSLKYLLSGPIARGFLLLGSGLQLHRAGHFLAPLATRYGHRTKFGQWNKKEIYIAFGWCCHTGPARSRSLPVGTLCGLSSSGSLMTRKCSQGSRAGGEQEPGPWLRGATLPSLDFAGWLWGREREKEEKWWLFKVSLNVSSFPHQLLSDAKNETKSPQTQDMSCCGTYLLPAHALKPRVVTYHFLLNSVPPDWVGHLLTSVISFSCWRQAYLCH